MDNNNLLLTVAVLAVVISFVGVSVTYNSINVFRTMTGFATTENGTVNLTVTSNAQLEITHANGVKDSTLLNWGSGSVNVSDPACQDFADLYTNATADNCSNGWNDLDNGFRVKNNGNVNLRVNISATSGADDFIGGTNPLFTYNVNDVENACTGELGETDLNTTEQTLCTAFAYGTTENEVEIELHVRIPVDTGVLDNSNTIILTYEEDA